MEAGHVVYLIRRYTPTNTNGGTNSRIVGARRANNVILENGVFEEQFLEPEEQIQEIPMPDAIENAPPMIYNLMNILEIFQHLAMNYPELKELMQQHPELAYIYNGPRHQVVSSMPNTTPLPNPWSPTISKFSFYSFHLTNVHFIEPFKFNLLA